MPEKKEQTEPLSHEELVAMHEELQQKHEALVHQHAALQARVAELEKHAHNEHTISKDTVDQIAAHAVHQVNEHLRTTLGHSGMPSR
jgi:hypothetical protein